MIVDIYLFYTNTMKWLHVFYMLFDVWVIFNTETNEFPNMALAYLYLQSYRIDSFMNQNGVLI